MKQYLLDTDICIYFIKGLHNLDKKILNIGIDNCFISEITIAELKFGVENSKQKEKNRKTIEKFINSIGIIPIISCLDVYAKEKARLRKQGTVVDEFDLLIGSSAIANNMSLVTRNTKHFKRFKGVSLENWID